MRTTAKWLLGVIIASIIASPFTEPINWWIGHYLDNNPDMLPDAIAQAWRVVQVATEFIPSGLFPGIAFGATLAFILLRGWKKENGSYRHGIQAIPNAPRPTSHSRAVAAADFDIGAMANLDRFINEFFIPQNTIFETEIDNFSSIDIDVRVMIKMILARDRELVATTLAEARYKQPSIEFLLDRIDICFDHYIMAVIFTRKGGNCTSDQEQREKIERSARDLFTGIRWLISTTPRIKGIGKLWRTSGNDLDFRIIR